MAHSSPHMARHRQAGKKETSVNQHGNQDLQKGKHQEEVKITVHHGETQFFCSSQLRDHKLRSTALCIIDSTERVDGEARMNFPAIPIYRFIVSVSPIQVFNDLDQYQIASINLMGRRL